MNSDIDFRKASEQVAFLEDLTKSILGDMNMLIVRGKIPPEWDGHELRIWLSDKFADAAEVSSIAKYPRSKRARNFRAKMLEL
jgi:hypothetical protein